MATRILAKKLGLVQKCTSEVATPPSSSEFDYVLVLDFEATCWKDSSVSCPEVIEFPVVLIDAHSGAVLDEFHHYVRPTQYPVLSQFCKKLTGIKQEVVDQALPLGACLEAFGKWLQRVQTKIGFSLVSSTASHSKPASKVATFATWSDWDLKVCLKRECRRKRLAIPSFFNCWIDVRALYKEFYHYSPKGLLGALQSQGLQFKGREHSGICDARNTAALIHRMVQDGCRLKISKAAADPHRHYPLGSL